MADEYFYGKSEARWWPPSIGGNILWIAVRQTKISAKQWGDIFLGAGFFVCRRVASNNIEKIYIYACVYVCVCVYLEEGELEKFFFYAKYILEFVDKCLLGTKIHGFTSFNI